MSRSTLQAAAAPPPAPGLAAAAPDPTPPLDRPSLRRRLIEFGETPVEGPGPLWADVFIRAVWEQACKGQVTMARLLIEADSLYNRMEDGLDAILRRMDAEEDARRAADGRRTMDDGRRTMDDGRWTMDDRQGMLRGE